MELLASVDEAYLTLNGAATKAIIEREYGEYGKSKYERLAGISVAHLYRLRQSRRYREQRMDFTKTKRQTFPLEKGAAQSPGASLASFDWIRCTKGIWMETRGCITSMRWIR